MSCGRFNRTRPRRAKSLDGAPTAEHICWRISVSTPPVKDREVGPLAAFRFILWRGKARGRLVTLHPRLHPHLTPLTGALRRRIALRERCSLRHVNMTISLAFLAPKLVRAAVEGRLPRGVNIARASRCSGRMVSPVRSARFDATAITYTRNSTVVNAPGMAPLNTAASAGESFVRQERDFWMRRPGPRNRRKDRQT